MGLDRFKESFVKLNFILFWVLSPVFFIVIGGVLLFHIKYFLLISLFAYLSIWFVCDLVKNQKQSLLLFLIPYAFIFLGIFLDRVQASIANKQYCEILKKDSFCSNRNEPKCRLLGVQASDSILRCKFNLSYFEEQYLEIQHWFESLNMYGEDSDKNGIRDDIDRLIASYNIQDKSYEISLKNEARSIMAILKSDDELEIKKQFENLIKARACNDALIVNIEYNDRQYIQSNILNNRARELLFYEKGKVLSNVYDPKNNTFWENAKLCEIPLEDLKKSLNYYVENDRYKRHLSNEQKLEFINYMGIVDKAVVEESRKPKEIIVDSFASPASEKLSIKEDLYLELVNKWEKRIKENLEFLETYSHKEESAQNINFEEILKSRCVGDLEYAQKSFGTYSPNSSQYQVLSHKAGLYPKGIYNKESDPIYLFDIKVHYENDKKAAMNSHENFPAEVSLFSFDKTIDLKHILLGKIYRSDYEYTDRGATFQLIKNTKLMVDVIDGDYIMELRVLNRKNLLAEEKRIRGFVNHEHYLKCKFEKYPYEKN